MHSHTIAQIDRQRFGCLVRAERRRQGLTQAELAQRTGMSISFLGHIERATRVPSMETVVALARALRFSLDEVFHTRPDHAILLSEETLTGLSAALDTVRFLLDGPGS